MPASVRRCFFLLTLWGATCTLQAQAPVSDSLQRQLRECADMNEDGERLACFDKVAASLPTGNATREATATPPTPPPPPPKAEAPARVSAKVTTLRALSTGALLIELDNGQSWRTIPEDARLMLKVGDTVTISRGAFGSFRLATPGNRFARVNRVR
jgi:hypothetical protein